MLRSGVLIRNVDFKGLAVQWRRRRGDREGHGVHGFPAHRLNGGLNVHNLFPVHLRNRKQPILMLVVVYSTYTVLIQSSGWHWWFESRLLSRISTHNITALTVSNHNPSGIIDYIKALHVPFSPRSAKSVSWTRMRHQLFMLWKYGHVPHEWSHSNAPVYCAAPFIIFRHRVCVLKPERGADVTSRCSLTMSWVKVETSTVELSGCLDTRRPSLGWRVTLKVMTRLELLLMSLVTTCRSSLVIGVEEPGADRPN